MENAKQRFNAAIAAVIVSATAAAAQSILVVGTGHPERDVPAAQAAVDQGGQVSLMGHFSFDRLPTKWHEHSYGRTVLVSKPVAISGRQDENGEITTIEGGFNPFLVNALGAHVSIQRLRFVSPKEQAIIVVAVSGLVIAHCTIEGVQALPDPTAPMGGTFAEGIFVVTTPTLFPPTATQPGQPENVSGTLRIFDNNINLGGTARDRGLGIAIFGVGKSPDEEVQLYISGNDIRNITERAIDIQHVGGRVYVERNLIATGTITGPPTGVAPDGIIAIGSGSYLIAHNSIVSEWATGAGIRVQGNAQLAEARAIVADNDVMMSAPEGAVFGNSSAGIEIRGLTAGNQVVNNRIRGRAKAALSVVVSRAGIPGTTRLS